MHFFCTEKQYLEWLATSGEKKQGYLLDVKSALEVAGQIFGIEEELSRPSKNVRCDSPESDYP